MDTPDSLPRDAQSILELAARSMFELFANASEGMLLVDRQARVVWVNDQYKRFLPALGFDRAEDFVGQPVAGVVPNTQMHQVLESGKPILIDLLSNRAGTFVVSRIPLRDRREDIPALVEVLGEDMALRSDIQPPEVSADALALLSAQRWPGNIRELRNVLEQAAMRSDSHRILPLHLEAVLREAGLTQLAAAPAALGAGLSSGLPEPDYLARPLAEQVAELERRAIGAALKVTQGNKLAAAKLLGMSRAKLYERLTSFAL